ncbi:MAG: hypothetical protein QXO69_03615 [archaeon]
MAYSREVEEYIDYVAKKLKEGKTFGRGAVENFAIDNWLPVDDIAREIIRRAVRL